MNSREARSSNFGRHVRNALDNRVRQNKNRLHVDGGNPNSLALLRRRCINPMGRAKMSDEDSEDFLEIDVDFKSEKDDPNVDSVQNQTGLKWEFRDETLRNSNFVYHPILSPSSRKKRVPSRNYRVLPTFQTLFALFLTLAIISTIVEETNCHANAPLDGHGNTKGEPHWENLIVHGLQAFMALALYMRLKVQPNYKTYWMHDSLFQHPIISNIFTKARFQELRRCLHLTNVEEIHREDLGYDKIGLTTWLVNCIRECCKLAWCLGKHLTVDEMMIRYKGTYSFICEYMPKKPQKWGLKMSCLACPVSKYVWNFKIYCGEENNIPSHCLRQMQET